MRSKVFVSCGQHTDSERQIARAVCERLEARGFHAYLAIDAQTILDINGGIIRELKNSDLYLFVNFRREPLGTDNRGDHRFRGSLFSNQELAIAYALGFEKLLIINQEGVQPEGMLRYIGINTEKFQTADDCVSIVERALDRAGWLPTYSRRLAAAGLRFDDRILHYGRLAGWFMYVDIQNHRSDIAALEATSRLAAYAPSGGNYQASLVRSPLKATGRPGFSHTIFPSSHEAFDLLCLGTDLVANGNLAAQASSHIPAASGAYFQKIGPECRAYLNSALDVNWASPLPITTGLWTLRYEFVAVDFPVLTVDIEVDVPGTFPVLKPPCARIINQELS